MINDLTVLAPNTRWKMGINVLGWFAAVFIGVWIAQLFLGVGPNLLLKSLGASDNIRTFVGTTITRLGVLAAVFLFTDWGLRKVTGMGLGETAFPPGVHWWQDLGIGCLLAFIPMSAMFGIEMTQSWLVVEWWVWDVEPWDSFLRNIWISLLSNLDAGVGEEVLFRGFLLLGLCRAWGRRTGLAVMALIFSVVHLLVTGASDTDWLLFSLLLTLPGVLLGVAYLRSESLWLPIRIHFTWDLAYDLFNLAGGYHPGLFGFITRQHGPEWFVGTQFGIEVGLAGILVAAFIWVGVWLYTRPRQSKRSLNYG